MHSRTFATRTGMFTESPDVLFALAVLRSTPGLKPALSDFGIRHEWNPCLSGSVLLMAYGLWPTTNDERRTTDVRRKPWLD